MNALVEKIISSHLWALVIKETKELLRNPHLLFLILVPPIIQLLILGASLDPQVHNLTLATVDHAQTKQSRDLVAELTTTDVFPRNTYMANEETLSRQLERGKLNVGLVIPAEFTTDLNKGKSANVQVLVDGADAYTAGIASSHILRTIHQFRPDHATEKKPLTVIDPQIEILYNPKQISSWFLCLGY